MLQRCRSSCRRAPGRQAETMPAGACLPDLLQALPENVTPGGRSAAGGGAELPQTSGKLYYFESCSAPVFRICCRRRCRRRAPRILAAAAVWEIIAPGAKDRRPEGRRACRVSYIDSCCSAGGSAGGPRLPSSDLLPAAAAVFRICCRAGAAAV